MVRITIFALGLLLSACGGGDSGGDNSSGSDSTSGGEGSEVTTAGPDNPNPDNPDTTDPVNPVVWEPGSCDPVFLDAADFTELPQVRIKPDAGVVLYLDFDGGRYKGEDPYLAPYYTGTAEQRANIVAAINHNIQYFAMFDVGLTTIRSDVGTDSDAAAWGWIIITPDTSGGRASGSINNEDDFARSRVSPSTLTPDEGGGQWDKSRRIAHELAHLLDLEHNGQYEDGVFYKFEDWMGWDGKFGSIMGGGGKGQRNGWVTAVYDQGVEGVQTQDSLEIIRQLILEFDPSTPNQGWAVDDVTQAEPLCVDSNGRFYRTAVLGHIGDEDRFTFQWSGGDLKVTAEPTEVSQALLDIEIWHQDELVGGTGIISNAAPGIYEVVVSSVGQRPVMTDQDVGFYEAIGYYQLSIDPP